MTTLDLEAVYVLLLARLDEFRKGLARRLDDSGGPESTARTLPDAMRLSIRHGSELADAMRPILEMSFLKAVQRHPDTLAKAISPIIGPSIRRAALDQVRKMVQELNRTLEVTLSREGFRWRLEALRTGKSFGEVVLLHCLVYSVDDVFLLHRESGVLLARCSRSQEVAPHGGEIAAMLTAIREFVRDAFASPAGQGVKRLEVGEVVLLVEDAGGAVVVTVIRGEPPHEYLQVLALAAQRVAKTFAGDLADFRGDVTPFEPARELLEDCLYRQLKSPPPPSAGLWRSVQAGACLLGAACLLAVVLAGTAAWRRAEADHRRQAELDAYLARLQQVPGVAMVQVSGGAHDGWQLAGLRDPLVDPAALAPPSALSGTVRSTWRDVASTDPRVVVERARRVLQPPATVALRVADATLSLSGAAPNRWIRTAKVLGAAIPGIERVDVGDLADTDASAYDREAAEVERTTLPLALLTGQPQGAQAVALAAVTRPLIDLDEHAGAMDRRYYVELSSRAVPDATPAVKKILSRYAGFLEWAVRSAGGSPNLYVRPIVVASDQAQPPAVHLRVVRVR